MQSEWRDADAEGAVAAYAAQGVNRDLALRVYTTRLLGRDPALVLHGGGNTSVKTRLTDALGDPVEVLCVKGSGWDMARIEPAGLPAVRLAALLRLEALPALSDEAMVNHQRGNLLDASAPNPSIETMLHAFLPHKFIDHTHANAVLALTDQPDGAARCRDLYGDSMALVPYIMPGFALAKAAAEAARANPSAEGLILLKHGIFTMGSTAREAYERMIAKVSAAEAVLARGRRPVFMPARLPAAVASAAAVAPILRGLAARMEAPAPDAERRWILEHRCNPRVLDYAGGADARRYSQAGVVTPDHTIRTKNWPLLVPAPDAADLDAFRAGAEAAFAGFKTRYEDYFARHNTRLGGGKKPLDAVPRVILVPGVGLFALGASAKDAKVAADVAEAGIEVITAAESIGRFESVSEADLFDVEYWSLEQAKLGKGREAALSRRVVLVTGGAGGIGAATARAFAAEGAEVALLDRDGAAAAAAARAIAKTALGLACDVTDPASVATAFAAVAGAFGGVDIVVSNAGAAFEGRIGEVDDATLRASFELNFFAHQTVAQNAVRVMRAQGTGGVLLFNVSKQAVNPGPEFGPYGLPKAATLFLMRQYAVDHGADGIRSNAVNADRVNTGLYADGLLEKRAKARGFARVEDYLAGGNLLRREVTPADVAEAFVALAKAEKTTAAVLTVDGGNIAAALR